MPHNNLNLFCKIYLDTDLDRAIVLSDISRTIGGQPGPYSSLVHGICDLDVIRNDDFNEQKRKVLPDGFLFSKYLIEIEPCKGIRTETYITTISRLLEGLWERGYKAVASCDFEELLLNKGGYNQLQE